MNFELCCSQNSKTFNIYVSMYSAHEGANQTLERRHAEQIPRSGT
jgi:hypothetical protein